MTPTFPGDLLMTAPIRTFRPSQVATMLGCHSKTVLAWIHSGRLKAKRFGCRWLVTEPDLQAFVDKGCPAVERRACP